MSEASLIERLKQGLFHHLGDIKKWLQLYVPLTGSIDQGLVKTTFDLDTEIQRFLKSKDHKQEVLLLTGSSGSGKSTYLRFLFQRLWSTFQLDQDDDIPVLIHLPSFHLPTAESLIQKVFQQHGLSLDEIDRLRKRRFLFLLDAFDELPEATRQVQSYLQPILDAWSCKIIIACRSQALRGDYREIFRPLKPKAPLRSGLREMNVESLNASNRDVFIKKYVSSGKSKWSHWREYQDALTRIPMSLQSEPLMLRMTLDILPHLVAVDGKRFDSETPWQDIPVFTRFQLYEEFMSEFFIQQEIRLMLNGQLGLLHGIQDIRAEMRQFCIGLAGAMFIQGVSVVTYIPPTSSAPRSATPWDLFFNEKDTLIRICRECAPLSQVGPHEWTFLHHSFLEYFTSLALSPTNLAAEEVKSSPVQLGVLPNQKSEQCQSLPRPEYPITPVCVQKQKCELDHSLPAQEDPIASVRRMFSSSAPSEWSVADVQRWFESDPKLSVYSKLVQEESVTGPLLLVLDDEDLCALGISKKIHRQRIRNQIRKWNQLLRSQV